MMTELKFPVLATVSTAVKTHCDHSDSYKGQHLIVASLQVQRLVHYYHGRRQGCMKADMVPEKDLRVLHMHWKAE